MKKNATPKKTRTIIPATPGYDIVGPLEDDKGVCTGLWFDPVVAWVVEDEDENDYEEWAQPVRRPVTLACHYFLSAHGLHLRLPSGRYRFADPKDGGAEERETEAEAIAFYNERAGRAQKKQMPKAKAA